jgi:hypothetical protein
LRGEAHSFLAQAKVIGSLEAPLDKLPIFSLNCSGSSLQSRLSFQGNAIAITYRAA